MKHGKKYQSVPSIPVLSLNKVESTSHSSAHSQRLSRLESALAASIIDNDNVKKLLWLGIPEEAPLRLRADAWRLVLGYLPVLNANRDQILQKKRAHYQDMCKQHLDSDAMCDSEQKMLKQIRVDLPRTHQSVRLFKDKRIQKLMERVLYIWSVRNPASGYVQGINDLLVVFVTVLARPYLNSYNVDTDAVDQLKPEELDEIEADCFNCLSKILSQMQDNYTENQPGVYKSLKKLKDLVKRIDSLLYQHLESINIDFNQFPFRWMNCMMVRELPLNCSIRLWDTYIAEIDNGFVSFHEYVSAAFLCIWSEELVKMDYQQCLLFLQSPPTSCWGTEEVDAVVSKAFVLKSMFDNSPNHFK